jgi:hypothetical protein
LTLGYNGIKDIYVAFCVYIFIYGMVAHYKRHMGDKAGDGRTILLKFVGRLFNVKFILNTSILTNNVTFIKYRNLPCSSVYVNPV